MCYLEHIWKDACINFEAAILLELHFLSGFFNIGNGAIIMTMTGFMQMHQNYRFIVKGYPDQHS